MQAASAHPDTPRGGAGGAGGRVAAPGERRSREPWSVPRTNQSDVSYGKGRLAIKCRDDDFACPGTTHPPPPGASHISTWNDRRRGRGGQIHIRASLLLPLAFFLYLAVCS